jgi:hypothetical protein
LNGWNNPFVKCVKYVAVIFDKRLHIEMIEVKAFRISIRIYFLFRSELLSTSIKLNAP